MRIADVLSARTDDDDEDHGEEVTDDSKRKRGGFDSSSLSSSARSLVPRWFSKSYSFKIMRRNKKAGPDSGTGSRRLDPPASSGEAAVDPPPGLMSSEVSVDPGRKHEDLSLTVGMGLGMAFLLAKSAAEFNKMRELRAEMEMLLKEIKSEVQSKDATASASESNNNILFSPPHRREDISTSKSISVLSSSSEYFALQGVKCDVDSDTDSKHSIDFANTGSLRIDEMEAELEVELERLQTNLEGECSSGIQHRMEVDREDNDPSYESFSVGCEEEENEPRDDDIYEYNGVSPRELERKLHELLETRQQERIEELESALENAEQKLREKEMELEWWKETQWLASLNKERTFI
ncbi:protein POLAR LOCALIZATION DURING ASYMMETRIC DIVISION AND REDISTRIBUTION-like [Asparagus officinalis]|nr:protein POLAR LOCALIZATION DURING ASYMMETRIC DIVISION AND REDISTRIBUTION-like [Asparagus officinalis]